MLVNTPNTDTVRGNSTRWQGRWTTTRSKLLTADTGAQCPRTSALTKHEGAQRPRSSVLVVLMMVIGMLTGALTLSQGYEAKLLKKEPQAHSRHGKKPVRSTAVAAHERVEAAPQMRESVAHHAYTVRRARVNWCVVPRRANAMLLVVWQRKLL